MANNLEHVTSQCLKVARLLADRSVSEQEPKPHPSASGESHWGGRCVMTLLLIECGDGNLDVDRAASLARASCADFERLLTLRPPWDYEVWSLVITLHAVRSARPSAFGSAWETMERIALRIAERQAVELADVVTSQKGFQAFRQYDLIQGPAATLAVLCVVGLRGNHSSRVLAKELASIVAWSDESPHLRVPHGLIMDLPVEAQPLGAHVNLGMAHGVLGVLASLVPFQNEIWARRPLIGSLLQLGAQALTVGSAEFPVGVRSLDRSVHAVASPQAFSWCYGKTGLAVVAEAVRSPDCASVHEWAAATALSLVTTADGAVVGGFDLAACHGLSGSLLLRGPSSLSVAQIDEALGSIDQVARRACLAASLLESDGFSLLEGLPGIALLGQLSRQDFSYTRWEGLLGAWSRVRFGAHDGANTRPALGS